MMAKSNEERRWERLVSSHGSQIRKLSKSDQREIRNLVNENRGADARRMVTNLDEERRMHIRVRSKLRRVMAKSPERRKGTNPFSGSDHDEILYLRELYDRFTR